MSFIFFYFYPTLYNMNRRDILLEKIEKFEKKYFVRNKINLENNELLSAKYKIISKLIRQGQI